MTDDLLSKYKSRPFASGLLTFSGAMRSLATRRPGIYAVKEGTQRWVICDANTKKAAIFSHAALIAQADPEETGNLVPESKDVPEGLEAKNVQHRANTKCFYTYVFDTFADLSLYEGQWTLDEYMGTVTGFNPRGLPRRAYLSGADPRYRSRFWMQTPMFLRGSGSDGGSSGSVLHPWVVDADKASSFFHANPGRPRVWARAGDKTEALREQANGNLQRGDLVAMSFMVTYHISNQYWFPQFHPVDILLLKRSVGFGEGGDYSAPEIGLHARPPPLLEVGSDDDSVKEDADARSSQERVGEAPGVGDVNKQGTPGDENAVEVEAKDASPDSARSHEAASVIIELDGEETTIRGTAETTSRLRAGEDDDFDVITPDEAPGTSANEETEQVSAEQFVDMQAEEEPKRRTRAGNSKKPGRA